MGQRRKANKEARDEAVTTDPGRDAGTRPGRNREGQTLVLSLLTLSSGACSFIFAIKLT